NLVAKFSINREGGSGGLSISDAERNAVVNIWPDNLPGFKETLLDYHATIERLGPQFPPLWAGALPLPPDYFDRFFPPPPPTRSPPPRATTKGAPHPPVRHRAAHRQRHDDVPRPGRRARPRRAHAVRPLARSRCRPRRALGEHRQRHRALDQ